jgi:hypothetical protein
MKKLSAIILATLALALRTGAEPAKDLRIPTGMGEVLIHVSPSPGLISITVHNGKDKTDELFSGTNLVLELDVAEDGCVKGITGHNGGDYYLDFSGTRLVRQETGEKIINNPSVVIGNKTNDIVIVWTELSKTDKRFVINKQKPVSSKVPDGIGTNTPILSPDVR